MNTLKQILLIAALALFAQACTQSEAVEKTEKKALKVATLTLQRQNVDIEKNFFGEVQFKQSMTVVSELSGKIEKLNIAPGARVEKDQILLTYPPQNHELQIEQARLAYDELKRNCERQEILFKKGAVSKLSVEQLQTQLDIQEKVLKQSNELYSIKAPFSGIITDVAVNQGKEVNAGDALLSIASTGQMEATFFVTSNAISKIANNAEVFFLHDTDTIKGHVSEKALTMDMQTRAYRVKAAFNYTKGSIISGSTVQLFVKTKTLENQIIIPWECIKRQGETDYVFLNNNGKAERTKVTIDQIIGINAIIKSGLKPGDVLITNGLAKLKNQMPVRS
ncbi:efflux RND transporter periplasmic adaptor subunit [uncultured Draconibacterium sp.]|uniref:efflux RND transporter periplasmic adaptor subunit n=1 Tax=uncultured Draconibacterium sp. TaxID=1573823 RepID=UPI0025CF630E|nr:efflux RND transporter periplasmic adaptor subunit [uncultured Draconibacterium sp.]